MHVSPSQDMSWLTCHSTLEKGQFFAYLNIQNLFYLIIYINTIRVSWNPLISGDMEVTKTKGHTRNLRGKCPLYGSNATGGLISLEIHYWPLLLQIVVVQTTLVNLGFTLILVITLTGLKMLSCVMVEQQVLYKEVPNGIKPKVQYYINPALDEIYSCSMSQVPMEWWRG